jgi:hypothetical protein
LLSRWGKKLENFEQKRFLPPTNRLLLGKYVMQLLGSKTMIVRFNYSTTFRPCAADFEYQARALHLVDLQYITKKIERRTFLLIFLCFEIRKDPLHRFPL